MPRDEMMMRLKSYIPNYKKGSENIYLITHHQLKIAVQRAEKLASQYTAYDDPEPYTGIVHLVKELISLRDN